MTAIDALPEAIHLGDADLPFVDFGGGNQLKVILVDEAQGLWVVENIFQAGFEVPTHKHTGPVFGFTRSGAWKYKEYDYVNRAGSVLYEPAGSVHTLTCLEDETRVWFHMLGTNLDLDADGKVIGTVDGPTTLAFYYALAEAQGLGRPQVVVR
jgi:2,4'-dihydroxyacetophenone dioxygenase